MAGIRRLTPQELDPALASALRPRVERLGYLGEFFACLGHQPRALLAFMELTEELKDALPADLTEVVALSVATSSGNDYERHQHERLSLKLGFEQEWIAEVETCAPDAAKKMTELQRAVQRVALAVGLRRGQGSAEIQALVDVAGDGVSAAVLMLVGRYTMHALIVSALQLDPPVPSIFEPAAR